MIPLSQPFIDSLAPRRHDLYAAAVANVSAQATGPLTPSALAARAEALLIKAVRDTFAAALKNSPLDAPSQIAAALTPAGTVPPETAMPADVWARLNAAIQVDAAQAAGARPMNPGAVPLNPDPLLAPKKSAAPEDDAFDFSSPSRFLLATAVAVFIGIALTVYILTRNSSAAPTLYPISTSPAATATSPATRHG